MTLFRQDRCHTRICPDFSGEICWLISEGNSSKLVPSQEPSLSQYQHLSEFRKPGPGMLKTAEIWANEKISLYIGDRPEDEAAAQAINVPFKWAEEWRTDGPKI